MLDPDESAEEKMSDALVLGCIGLGVGVLLFTGLAATIIKVWL